MLPWYLIGIPVAIVIVGAVVLFATGTLGQPSSSNSSRQGRVSDRATDPPAGAPAITPPSLESPTVKPSSAPTQNQAIENADRAKQLYDTACQRLDAKEYAQALIYLKESAALGSATAMCQLGYMYGNGLGTAKDEHQGYVWYEKSANAGYPLGMYSLAGLYHAGQAVKQDDAVAFRWYSKAAELGCPEAMCDLGFCYQQGFGTDKDQHVAVKWYQKAAAAGNAGAMWNLGVAYRQGIGVDQDEKEAIAWWTKAEAAGHVEAHSAMEKLRATANAERYKVIEKLLRDHANDSYVKADCDQRFTELVNQTERCRRAGDVAGMEKYNKLNQKNLALASASLDGIIATEAELKRYPAEDVAAARDALLAEEDLDDRIRPYIKSYVPTN